MPKNIIATILFCFLSLAAVADVDFKNSGDVAYYTRLRMDYASRPGYEPGWGSLDERKAVAEAFKSHDFDRTIELGMKWVGKVPVDAEAYLMMAMAAKELGDFKGYCAYIEPFYGLLHSITSVGDGKSSETAFKVISVEEEYYLLREIGAKVDQQSLIGHCDKMDIERRGGAKYTVYFDVSISLKAMQKMFEHK